MSWFVRPDVVRLPLSDGQWITVKKQLSAGEKHDAHARMAQVGVEPMRVDVFKVGPVLVLAYLVDWSLTDDDGHPVSIKGEPLDVVEATIRALQPERFDEIHEAIARHELAIAEARLQKKTIPPGEIGSSPISISPVGAGGGTSG